MNFRHIGPYRFFFTMNDRDEPAHIHVEREGFVERLRLRRRQAAHVAVTEDELVVHLVDGRKLSVPLVWFPSLLHATAEQRNMFRLIGEGEYIN